MASKKRTQVDCRDCGQKTTAADGVCRNCSESYGGPYKDNPIGEYRDDDADPHHERYIRPSETYHGDTCRDDL